MGSNPTASARNHASSRFPRLLVFLSRLGADAKATRHSVSTAALSRVNGAGGMALMRDGSLVRGVGGRTWSLREAQIERGETHCMWTRLHTLGTIGCENRTIVADEEYKQSCRITMERCQRGYAITCGVYGDMVHTAFAEDANCWKTYHAIRNDLQTFVDSRERMSDREIERFYSAFTRTYGEPGSGCVWEAMVEMAVDESEGEACT